MVASRFVTVSLLVLGLIGCGGDGGGVPTGTGGGPGVQAPLLPDLMRPIASVAGGLAEGPNGMGTDAGPIRIASRGGISLDPGGASDAPPAMPAGGTTIGAAELGADVTRQESIQIDGKVT